MKYNTFSMIDEYGNEIVYDVLFTFDNDSSGKSYIVYTDNSRDEKGNLEVDASIYNRGKSVKLTPIETEEEWSIREHILSELQQKVRRARRYS